MEASNAIQLIKHKDLTTSSITQWADLGCGTGFFTGVLSTFLVAGSTIYAVDNNATALAKVRVAACIHLKTFALDVVNDELPFGALNGVMMANSLHYIKNKNAFIEKLKAHLNPGGCILIVEYDMETPNTWVPYPVTFNVLQILCKNHGLTGVEKISQMPSAFGRANMYAALATL